MVLFDVGSTLLIYIIGLRFYNARRAFTAGILYATAISASYFVLTKYDAYPTFFLLLSLALFLYGREAAGYLAGAWGALVKWFPSLALPLFLICDVKRGVKSKLILRNLCLSILLVLAVTLPFFLLNPSGFLETYTSRTGATVLTHSFVYYLDFLARTLSGPAIFGGISLLITAIAEIGLFIWYYRQPRKDDLTLSSFLFIAVALFIITNPVASPQYLQWITPFMALFLAGQAWEILLFYAVQVWGYLEFPLLYNRIYNNISGYGPAEAGFPAAAFLFFTVKFALFFLVLGLIIQRILRAEEEETQGVP